MEGIFIVNRLRTRKSHVGVHATCQVTQQAYWATRHGPKLPKNTNTLISCQLALQYTDMQFQRRISMATMPSCIKSGYSGCSTYTHAATLTLVLTDTADLTSETKLQSRK